MSPWEQAGEPACAILANDIPVSAIANSDVTFVRPETPTSALLSLMMERGISGVPVVDEFGRPVGVVSKTDLLRGRGLDAGGDGPVSSGEDQLVGELMTPMTLALPEKASVAQAAALMAFENVHRLPIVSTEGKVVGIVTPMDVLRLVAGLSGYELP